MSQASITSLFTPSGKGQHATQPGDYTPSASSSKAAHTRKHSELDDTSAPEATPLKRPRVTAASRLQSAAPLAERLRPRSLDEFVGQPHLTEPGSLLMSHLGRGATGSIIFWGPPGCVSVPVLRDTAPLVSSLTQAWARRCGKTTLARLLASRTDAVFKELSATDSGIADVRSVVEEAKNLLALTGR